MFAGCEYGGIRYKETESVKTLDPCLECICESRQIQCRLKMCPTLPEPPPRSCHILQRPNTCCPKLLCQNGRFNPKGRSGLESKLNKFAASTNSEGCILNGTVYGEGSAMVTSSLCEYCYCIKGKQHCVRPQCLLTVPGCYPQYNKHSCCPTKYNCSNLSNQTASTSTTKLPTSTPSLITGCVVNGTRYPEGERVQRMESECKHCYCLQGRIMCDPVVCKVPINNDCTPVHSNGHCCPTSYNCKTTTENAVVKELNETEETTTFIETTEYTTTLATYNDTEERSGIQNDILVDENTTGYYTLDGNTSESVTMVSIQEQNTNITLYKHNSTNDSSSSQSPVRSIPYAIEEIINRTLEKDDDYDYDYNESSLPPSLPNLKIIPFVAADAVVNEPDEMYGGKSRTSESPIYFDISIAANRFSPPSETEGGFMPRDPIIDGPFYETKFEEPFTAGNPGVLLEHTSESLFPPITEPPKLFEEGKCHSKGRTYHHGEVVSEPNACELCVCYYGEVHCQQPKCTPLNDGCHRVQDDTDVKGNGAMISEEMTPSTFIPESLSNIPAITVADVVVTPNPFKDVIRTEPAPDLVHIMKDMLPHLHDSTLKESTTTTINMLYTTTNRSKIIEDDYDDTFSFGSVLDLLFNNGYETNKTKLKTTTVVADKEKQPINNITRETTSTLDNTIESEPITTDKLPLLTTELVNINQTHSTNTDNHQSSSSSSIPSTGLLKLAGCNIYGRMYRVGRIISELSGPCLECMCTEIGVQCNKLSC
ncbi:hypothetical protein O3M35_012798 [Rhynocoris fuscipes]|uniref:VWFC domain-containing protein n=1 Tax=Rhynocoris fuscipes TaxID=488301 RepID=A0AAW1CEI7_9HEMI